MAPGCSQPTPSNNDGGTADQAPPKRTGPKIKRKFVYRLIAGVSMGGGMASIIGTRNPDKFDIIGTLGAPNDLRYLMHYIQKGMLGGFCDLKKMEEAAKNKKLNSKEAYCEAAAAKPKYKFEYTSHYNNWHYDDAGGNWNRPKLVRVLQDLFLGLGNPGYHNEKSPYWPHSSIPNNRRDTKDRCNNPIRIKGVKHYLYNPEGKYDLITYCDGNTARDGIFHPDRPQEHTKPVEIALAVDINGNGKRDYGEPIFNTPFERYDDVGKDGCANDKEDGKGGCGTGKGGEDPNGDDYHPLKNPNGTEGNMAYDEGEPYKDFGLDGIENTKDYGEGDGKFTVTPNFKNVMAHSPADLVKGYKKDQIDRLNIYIDGGIRDLFNFHITALHMLGKIKTHYKDDAKRAQLFDRFISLMPKGTEKFDVNALDWSDKGQHVYIRYGNPNATPKEIEQGDGDHVHGGKILDRLLTFMSFATYHMPKPDLKPEVMNADHKEGIIQNFVYDSKALKRKHLYSVVLPPGFGTNPKIKYPVIYFGHGYGMDGPGMASFLSLIAPLMADGYITKMIMVSLHGKCQQYLPDPNRKGSFIKKRLDACEAGTFFVDGKGINNDGPQMEKAFFEIVNEVETKYKGRIRQPETLDYYIPNGKGSK